MFDFLLDILEINIDYKSILAYAGIYLVSLWMLFCIWVYFDAKKRYTNSLVPIGLLIAVFFLNFPALIFYLIIRPEDDDFMFFGDEHHHSHGGVNVPLANFVGKDGNVELSFNLSINSAALHNPNFKIDVSMDEKNPSLKKVDSKSVVATNVQATQVSASPESSEKVKETLNVLKSKVGKNAKNILSNVKNYSSNLSEKEKATTTTETSSKTASK